MIITLAHTKGGVGKSTLAWHLAHSFHGKKVAIIDLDFQQTLHYINLMGGELLKLIQPQTSEELIEFFTHSASQYDFVIVDVGGFDSDINRTALRYSDKILIPVSDDIENIQRDDLTDYEIAMAIVRLWESGQYEQKTQLAQAIAKPLSYVSKAFACVNLDESIKSDIEENKSDIGLSVLQELSRVDPQKQGEVFEQYKSGQITRDQFKEAGKSTEPKISRGKNEKVITTHSGYYIMGYFNVKLDPDKQYKITIEEIV